MHNAAWPNRRQAAATLLAVCALAAAPARAALASFPVPTSLQDELALALKAREPLVLMVSLDGCPFCKIARENYLAPLVREQGLRVVQINMQHKALVKDVRGTGKTQEQLIGELKVTVAPTLIFYGANGTEVAERLVGMGSEDFYGAYLDQRIATARANVRR
jgi:thioredoxin-related protein